MEQVWKYVLQREVSLLIPAGAEILSVAAQGNEIYLWAKVNPNAEKVNRHFVSFGTGHDIADDLVLRFLGTAHLASTMVFHVFEKIQKV